MKLTASGLAAGYSDSPVFEKLDLSLESGAFTVIVGPNACGKSTLLRTLARLLPARHGTVLLDGNDIHSLPTREVARRLGVLPQSPLVPEGVTVADLVGRGRQPHQRWWRQWSAEDTAAVLDATERAGVADLRDRAVDQLSGGQRQRVWIATTLLDEPTTFLDLAHQVEVLTLIERMRDGRIVAGPPRTVVTVDLVRDVFGLDCVVVPSPVSGAPLVVPALKKEPVS